MADTGWLTADIAEDQNIVPAATWVNYDDARADDGTFAHATLAGASGQYSNRLVIRDFDCAIPEYSVITGVEVEIQRYTLVNATYTKYAEDYLVKLYYGAETGNNKAEVGDWPTSEGANEYGGSSDKWGVALTRSMVNSTNFGVAVRAYRPDASGSAQAYVDAVRMKVHYTPPWPQLSQGQVIG